jgi:hypothetical protein
MSVALIALFVALGGSSYAAIKIGAGNLKRGAVGSRAIADNSVRSKDVRNGTVAGKDVKDDSLTNADINNQGLQASTADTAGNAANAANAANANELDGLDSTAFTRGACGSTSGAIHGYARVIGSAQFPSSFTTADVESPYNCSGESVEARRTGMGFYEIRFNGTVGGLAVATPFQAPSASPSTMHISLSRTSSGTFAASIENSAGALTDWPFVIVLL